MHQVVARYSVSTTETKIKGWGIDKEYQRNETPNSRAASKLVPEISQRIPTLALSNRIFRVSLSKHGEQLEEEIFKHSQ